MIKFENYDDVKSSPEVKALVDPILPDEAKEVDAFLWFLGGNIYFMETPLDIMTVPSSIDGIRLIEEGAEYDNVWVFYSEEEATYAGVYVVTNDGGGDVYLFNLELLKTFPEGLKNLDKDNRINL